MGGGRRATKGHEMTANKHFKQLLRARMAATGESYTAARAQLLAAETDVVLDDPVTVDVHGRHGQTVTFTPDGVRVLSGGQDARIAVLDAGSGTVEAELAGHTKVVNAVAVTPDGRTVVSVSSDRTVRIWDLGEVVPLATMDGHRDAVVALALSPGGEQALTGGYDGRLRLWDLSTRECVHETRSALKRIAAVGWSPDGHLTVEAGQGPTVYVRATATDEVVAELDTGSPGVVGLAVAHDGAMLATAGYDGTVVLWDCDGWQQVRALPVGARVNAVTFSRSGQLLAAAAARRLVVWSSDDEPVTTADLPIDGVYDVALSPDARRLAQTGADGKVRIWTLR